MDDPRNNEEMTAPYQASDPHTAEVLPAPGDAAPTGDDEDRGFVLGYN